MAPSRAPSAQLLRSLRNFDLNAGPAHTIRALSTSCRHAEEAQVQRESFYKNPNPETAFVPRLERKLVAAGTPPVGSRRRRMAIAQSQGIPFDQLPFQCFQEARKVLIEDRQEKLKQIETMRARVARLQETNGNDLHKGGEPYKQKRLASMRKELEHLKILADINDPNVKRRFEDKKGDMNKPIYRYLADRKWREYRRKILVQRITQLKVIPDVTPHCDPIIDVKMSFGRKNVQPGDFVDSAISEKPVQLAIQSFEQLSKLVTIAIIDPDVPNLTTDAFDSRCHFLATNIQLGPTTPQIDLAQLPEEQVLVPWLPPTALKGAPYNRLSILILQQKDNIPIEKEAALKNVRQDDFRTRTFLTRHMLHPIGATLFRTKWDDSMASLMNRAGIDGADMELKRVKVEPLPYKRRNPSTFR
ncbi:mitochondrial 54S ribosomal protein YmL35 [Exophiala xenobiotica]|uniref:Mitochondrial 54S ribosomal protein YmL35 n=1 Tax=Lithohypha guttulata TaxID=1690604 RepID=A0ABR0KEL7_9EURO|nr:mitochondrial 54S ribosomal protein YmL35 [Lithohypha guttulata]KAK5321677.1 mitochondrial 54S ribosomal protein YmL35 [Exophiala xenobiotica]